MTQDGQRGDKIVGVGRGRVHRSQGAKRSRRAIGYTLALTLGLLFVAVGVVFGLDNVAARLHFDDAEKVPAVVVDADYNKPQLKQSAKFVSVALTGGHNMRASIDNVGQAPDDLSPGDHVTVLYDAARPGHALLPSQLRWEALMIPGGLFLVVGLVPTIVYGLAISRVIYARLRS
ncbi:DUF3592 domain-containing protein [Streptomyces sp. NPDC020898]|uniref:DUF3592 domain-containing protein n=1 Tax=Streptomyces sp. NPDC020898 TaxID=3365101 RepID=UPI0037B24FEC